ncbi:kynureninase [Pseudidiomarina terrestris]|uniref:kynureninase n=1 Tax=Pseudidiomarina terrestris TaxID=2820060 RepID=UPI00264F87A1|nr:kynureninase [Pseudidiomarina sp. 1ASP75-5]MDN7136103.1 kynureninase [Pseudidiomarina sp. 1ASP75-5]
MNFSALERLDQADPLAHLRDEFVIPEDTVYLDGNSLGLMTHGTQARVAETTAQQWGQDGIRSWNEHGWVHLPAKIGDKLAPIIGAQAGQVICCDSISVNLFKTLSAAFAVLDARGEPRNQRHQVLSTADNFPTDLYMVQGLQQLIGAENCELVLADEAELLADLSKHIHAQTAIVMLTEVNFRSGRRLPMAEIIAHAHAAGALVIVDLAHSAGAVPVELDKWQADFAVGCTYKYLNGGPGAPAFVYVAERHLGSVRQPLSGWFGHARPFVFDAQFEATDGIGKMLSGTPSILAMSAVDAALDVFADVTMVQVREKSIGLAELFLELLEQTGLAREFDCISPKTAQQRGSQLSFAHPDAYAICQALIEHKVIADFRAPNYLRVGFTPLYTSFTDIGRAVARLAEIMQTRAYTDPRFQTRQAVT